MNTIITVENLAKKYTLRHQPREQYTALRDVISSSVSAWTRRMFNPGRTPTLEHATNEEFWALNNISFQISAGDRIGIIGRNGAGKSTLLKIMSRITEPTKGCVKIRGRVASLLEVGTGFHPELTGRENIFLNGAILGMSRAEIRQKFDEIVDFAEIEKFLDTPVKRYSSGMYVRLAFAVAAHLDPEVLLVDEVLAVGDLQFQKKCLGRMEEISSHDGKTIIFVSHNLEAIRKLCTSALLLKQGLLIMQGTVHDVLWQYVNNEINLSSEYLIPGPKERDMPAVATCLSIEDETGNKASSLVVGKPWQIRISFTVARYVKGLVLGLGFSSDMNFPLRTAWSDPLELDAGTYDAVFKENQVILSPGDYPLTVGLTLLGRSIHYVENAGYLRIAEISDGGFYGEKIHNVGLLLNPMPVAIERRNT